MHFLSGALIDQFREIALRNHAWADLFCVLAEVFGYPSAANAEVLASPEMMEYCQILVSEARLACDEYTDLQPSVSERSEDVYALLSDGHRLRAECSRLFWSYPRLVRLEGRHWVKSDGRGEVADVGDLYRELGLCNHEGLNAPPDVLASELDYMGYVLRAEANAWECDDSLSALEWRQLGVDFLDKHLRPCAKGVSEATLAHSSYESLRFYVLLLACCTAGK